MISVGQLLGARREVLAVSPGATVREARDAMERNGISALAVTERDALVGIVTERDLVRKAWQGAMPADGLLVRDILTTRLVTVSPEDSTDACMALMIEHHVRHLPVVEHGRAVGMLSMRDLVRQVLADRDFVIRQMSDYIAGAPGLTQQP